MPGCVVDFLDMAKRKGSRKAALVCKIFTCILSDLDVIYRYVARHGCLSMRFHQRFRWTRIEIIIFLVMPKWHLSRVADALRVVSGAIPRIQGLK